MSKKNPAQPNVVQYTPVEVRPQYCSDEELSLHLEAFVKSFIVKEDQERWLMFLVEKRSKWYPVKPNRPDKYYRKAMREFEAFFPLQERVGTINGVDAYPQALMQTFGTAQGVYFDLREPACKVTAAEAASLVRGADGYKYGTAILSLIPGEKALFFDYEMEESWQCIWVCKRA